MTKADASIPPHIRILADVADVDGALADMPDTVGLVVFLGAERICLYWRLSAGENWSSQEITERYQTRAEAKLRRGDTPSLVTLGGESVVSIDASGRLVARLHPSTIADLARVLPEHELPRDAVRLGRGDALPLISIGDEIVAGVDQSGLIDLRLSEDALADIAARFNVPGGRPVGPEMVPDFDAWNVRKDGDTLYFNAHIWGPTAREYLRYGPGDPWANAHREVLLRLVFGDEFTDTSPSVEIDHFTHILTFNDEGGQAGLNGEEKLRDADDIQRPSRGFASTAADTYLRHCRGPKHWHGVRAETVMGAELNELTQGAGLRNLIETIPQFRRALEPYGRHPAVQTVSILQGATEDSSDYAARLLTLCGEIAQSLGARQINLYQPVGDAFRADYASVLQTPKAFVERGALPVVLVAPIYWCERRAGSLVQVTPESMTMLAELDGLATKDWLPPLAFLAERDGNVVTIDFEVMKGHALVAPTHGLSLISDNDIEIEGWEIVPDPVTEDLTRLRVVLTGVPENGRIRYAYDNIEASFDLSGSLFCSGGDMRDDWSARSVTGKTLHRYAFAFEFRI
ncbi:hypothetical protein SAMN04488515_2921 [Cognatiyoonia koreensis]|uniref:Uncharacterized protein n=1 Tax=Cognatiyoonia koreensis TaxID=364200 RepID=A0A1I0RLR7_9RHOB|nr:hypothetical protein [Cognatiyoonia koreensis]SEW42109.1 hypothetical protein SAMN04488515_2921 [Cognatiyoonia koreensis]